MTCCRSFGISVLRNPGNGFVMGLMLEMRDAPAMPGHGRPVRLFLIDQRCPFFTLLRNLRAARLLADAPDLLLRG
jgi:hypothetical protein